jgi:hypothetical protein
MKIENGDDVGAWEMLYFIIFPHKQNQSYQICDYPFLPSEPNLARSFVAHDQIYENKVWKRRKSLRSGENDNEDSAWLSLSISDNLKVKQLSWPRPKHRLK